MPLELGTHPKPAQIAEALVNVGGVGAWPPAYPLREDSLIRAGMFYTAYL
jgi:hypothetical protein